MTTIDDFVDIGKFFDRLKLQVEHRERVEELRPEEYRVVEQLDQEYAEREQLSDFYHDVKKQYRR